MIFRQGTKAAVDTLKDDLFRGSHAELEGILAKYVRAATAENKESCCRALADRLRQVRRPAPWFVAIIGGSCLRVASGLSPLVSPQMAESAETFVAALSPEGAQSLRNHIYWPFGEKGRRAKEFSAVREDVVESLVRLVTMGTPTTTFHFGTPSTMLVANILLSTAEVDPSEMECWTSRIALVPFVEKLLLAFPRPGSQLAYDLRTILDIALGDDSVIELSEQISQFIAENRPLALSQV